MTFRNPILGAGGSTLLRPAIQSPNYIHSVSGWSINRSGDAEFNDLSLRGTYSGTDFILDASGLYIYDGTPAAGNLIASITPVDGTDSFGNTVLGGITTYAGEVFTSLWLGSLDTGLIAQRFHSGGVGLVGEDGLAVESPWTDTASDQSSFLLMDGDRSVTPLSDAGFPHVMTMGTVWCQDPIIRANNNANVWTPEAWHAPAYNTGWSGSTSFGTLSGGLGTLRYRLDAEDNVWLVGAFKAATGASFAAITLPTGYRPKTNCAFPVTLISSGGTVDHQWMYVSTAGNLNVNSQLGSATTVGTTYFVNAKIPLGNVA